MKPALPAPHQLLTTLEYRVTLVRPREIVLLGGRVLVRAGEEGLGLWPAAAGAGGRDDASGSGREGGRHLADRRLPLFPRWTHNDGGFG